MLFWRGGEGEADVWDEVVVDGERGFDVVGGGVAVGDSDDAACWVVVLAVNPVNS